MGPAGLPPVSTPLPPAVPAGLPAAARVLPLLALPDRAEFSALPEKLAEAGVASQALRQQVELAIAGVIDALRRSDPAGARAQLYAAWKLDPESVLRAAAEPEMVELRAAVRQLAERRLVAARFEAEQLLQEAAAVVGAAKDSQPEAAFLGMQLLDHANAAFCLHTYAGYFQAARLGREAMRITRPEVDAGQLGGARSWFGKAGARGALQWARRYPLGAMMLVWALGAVLLPFLPGWGVVWAIGFLLLVVAGSLRGLR